MSSPRIAAMVPCPTGTAFCIALPRSLTRTAAFSTEKTPAAVNAEYSPKECPATALARS